MSHLWKLIFCRLHESLVMGALETVRQNSKDMRLLTGRVPGSVRPAQAPASGCWQWPKARVSGRPRMQVKQPILRHPTARTCHRPTTCPRSSTESPMSWPPSQSGANQGGRRPLKVRSKTRIGKGH